MPGGRDVIIIGDADKPGQAHASTVALALARGYRGTGKAASVHLVTPQQMGFKVVAKGGRDISDWLDEDQSRGAAEVQALIDGAEAFDDEAATKAEREAPPAKRRNAPAAASLDERLDTSPAAIARRMIRRFGPELLIVSNIPGEKFSTGYALDTNTGIWSESGDPWAQKLVLIERDMRADVIDSGLGHKEAGAALAKIERVKRPGMVKEVQSMLKGVLLDLHDYYKEPHTEVMRCDYTDLDSRMRYIGAANGVIDLHTGTLLAPAEGRKELVTLSTPVDFDPTATHPDVDRLFAHLEPEAVGWWWRVLGYHLRGVPSGRVYEVKGPPFGGKSTLIKALSVTLGPYVSMPAGGVLEDRRNRTESETQLTPGLEAFASPRRLALINEVKPRSINNRLVKDLSGDGFVTYRRLQENLRTVPATATMFLFCNEGSEPRLHTEDAGMRRRLRTLPYPEVPAAQREPRFINVLVEDAAFRAALLARLVAEASKATDGEPPADVPTVAAATAERIRDDVGELGAFARRIVPGGDVLTVAEVWEAWCEHNGEPASAQEPGGIGKRRLSKALRDHVPQLRDAKSFSVHGRKLRGWRGWRLLSPEEAEQADAEQQAEKTEPPADYDPNDEAKQAIRELLADFPDDFSVFGVALDHKILLNCLLELRNDFLLVALRDRYSDGRHLAEQLQKIAKISLDHYDPEEAAEALDFFSSPGWADLDADVAVAGWLLYTISAFAWLADSNRPVGPVYEQARNRFDSLHMASPGRENIALNFLFGADRRLGPEADTGAMVRKAVELLLDELNRTPSEEAKRYEVNDIEAAIKELVGLKDRAPAAEADPVCGVPVAPQQWTGSFDLGYVRSAPISRTPLERIVRRGEPQGREK